MKNKIVILFLGLLSAYVLSTLLLPTDPAVLAKHQITETSAKLLGLTIVIPVCLIYLTALYGYLRVRSYSETVSDTKEGPHFNNLATGLLILSFSLPVSSLIASVYNYTRQFQPHFASDVTVLRTYVSLAFATASFLLIAKGAHGLYLTLRQKPDNRLRLFPNLSTLAAIAIAALFTWLITTQGGSESDQGYGMPDWLVVTTIAIPYTYIWSIGFGAAVDMLRFKNKVRGKLYQKALGDIALGVFFIVLIFILIQFLTTLSGPLNRLNLTPLLIVLYLLIIVYAIGFVMVARGSKKLKQIEEA